MATDAEIASLRRATALELNDLTYTDELLGPMIDNIGFDATAAVIWREKAASYSALVDTTESGSSRSLSQLHKNAVAIAGMWEPDPVVQTGGSSFTVGIERI